MDERLKRLFEYTTFHIGMYTTLTAAIVGVFANKNLACGYENFLPFIKVTIVCWVVAGAFGGLVASSIPSYRSYDEFEVARIGPWNLDLLPAIVCIHLEHTTFWIGIVTSVLGLFRQLQK